MGGLDQGPYNKKEIGYIYFIKFYPDLLLFIQDKFGKEKVMYIEETWNWDVERKKKTWSWYDNEKYSNKIIILREKNIHTNKEKKLITYYASYLFFPINMIKFMHQKLKLEFPDHSKAHKGNRIM